MAAQSEFQRYARDCLDLAAKSADAELREVFIEMAGAWTRVALLHHDTSKQIAFDETWH